MPVLGSGHPLADIFLLKHRPQPSEASITSCRRWMCDEKVVTRLMRAEASLGRDVQIKRAVPVEAIGRF